VPSATNPLSASPLNYLNLREQAARPCAGRVRIYPAPRDAVGVCPTAPGLRATIPVTFNAMAWYNANCRGEHIQVGKNSPRPEVPRHVGQCS
uniref:hypothetical protein n=1 Tax=Cephaloticoccus sp. TaxID=1985742 RepID=UPI0040498250